MCGKITQLLPDGTVRTVMPMHFLEVQHLARGLRKKTQMRWGFVRQSANDPTQKPDHIHARSETLDEKPTFREAFAYRRGLVEVTSFNEGREIANNKTEQYVIRRKDRKPVHIAVLYELWVNAKGDELYNFVMVTTAANDLIGTITDRMPAVLPPEDHARWLGEKDAAPDELKALLKPYPSELLTMEAEKKQPPPKRPKPAREDQPSLF